jgi:hypothetical protein
MDRYRQRMATLKSHGPARQIDGSICTFPLLLIRVRRSLIDNTGQRDAFIVHAVLMMNVCSTARGRRALATRAGRV